MIFLLIIIIYFILVITIYKDIVNKNLSVDGIETEIIIILIELFFLNISILFTFYLYIKNNGMVNNIRKKFGTFGQFK